MENKGFTRIWIMNLLGEEKMDTLIAFDFTDF